MSVSREFNCIKILIFYLGAWVCAVTAYLVIETVCLYESLENCTAFSLIHGGFQSRGGRASVYLCRSSSPYEIRSSGSPSTFILPEVASRSWS